MKEFYPEISKDESIETEMKNKTNSEKEENEIEIQDNVSIDINQKRNYGNTYPLLFWKNEPLIVIGPDWKYFLLIYPIGLIIFLLLYSLKIKPKMNFIFQIISALIFIFFTLSYFLVVFKNPGIPPILTDKSQKELKNYRQCSICYCIVDLESQYITYHCSICDICVENFNHHCPYATKCIANGNYLYFYFFIISVPILLLGEIIIVLV